MAHKFPPRSTGAFFIALLILIYSCGLNSKPVSDKEIDSFCNTYTDLVLIQLRFKGNDKKYKTAESAVFEKNGLTKDEFSEFKKKISSKPELENEIYHKLLDKLKTYQDLPVDSLNKLINSLAINKTDK
jgi:hypothetical protein